LLATLTVGSYLVLSGHRSIKTEIVVQRKLTFIFKNLAFTPEKITIYYYLSDLLYFFSRP
ncbi:MAG: hypothetical protein LLF95_02205, partial [Bacteroidales bacterium]|nr:hypothetical protein [Bacteroidales bacterium]